MEVTPIGAKSPRLAVGSALFISYFIHFCSSAAVYVFNKGNKASFVKIERNMFLFGIACVLSFTWLQYGVFHAVLAWFTAVPLLFLHASALSDFIFFSNKKNYLWVAFYMLLCGWYLGIIIDFYTDYKEIKSV